MKLNKMWANIVHERKNCWFFAKSLDTKFTFLLSFQNKKKIGYKAEILSLLIYFFSSSKNESYRAQGRIQDFAQGRGLGARYKIYIYSARSAIPFSLE